MKIGEHKQQSEKKREGKDDTNGFEKFHGHITQQV
jgi:hypothetical protein